ncbi:MAG: carboxypeptidase-like regulatory domain-containing protein [Cyanobacteria bacterium P01_G01_bin.38]
MQTASTITDLGQVEPLVDGIVEAGDPPLPSEALLTPEVDPAPFFSTGLTAPVEPESAIDIHGDSTTLESLLVGVILSGQEVGDLEVLKLETQYWVPLIDFAALADIQIEHSQTELLTLKTPLGEVRLSPADLLVRAGIQYLPETLIEENLAAPIQFDSTHFALRIDLPWRQQDTVIGPTTLPEPDFIPPANSLAVLRQEQTLTGYNHQTDYEAKLTLGGRFLGGSWRMSATHDFVSAPELTDYFWYRRQGQTHYLLGRENIHLSPLLENMEITGAQWAWTNYPVDQRMQAAGATALIPRRSNALKTFRGEAPPASLVQLNIDGNPVAQTQVGLSGLYEFFQIPLPGGQAHTIEILIFDRNDFSVPAEIRQQTLSASELLLPAGGTRLQAGIGIGGDGLQQLLSDGTKANTSTHLIAFAQWRQALSDDFTVETTVQNTAEGLQLQGGMIWRVFDPVILEAGVAIANEQLAYKAALDAQFEDWQLHLHAQHMPAGFRPGLAQDRSDYRANLRYTLSPNITLGVMAQHRQAEGTQTSYLLPTFQIHPWQGLSITGRPNLEGDYTLRSFWQLNPNLQIVWLVDDSSLVNVNYKLNETYSLGGTVPYTKDSPTDYSLHLTRNPQYPGEFSFRLGLHHQENQWGYSLGAGLEILPGVLAQFDYQSLNASTGLGGSRSDNRFVLRLTSDFVVDRGQLNPARTSSISQNRGAISGQVKRLNPIASLQSPLDKIEISIVGTDYRTRVQTNEQGHFFVPGLPEGRYVLELDPAQLPFELTPLGTVAVAQVEAGAVTSTHFEVQLEFGLAGRVTRLAGDTLAGIPVQLIGPDQTVLQVTHTDQFGLYRMDRIPPGRYRIRVPNEPGQLPLAEHPVELRDSFLFDQDLTIN